jgi:hypothetical protein
MDQELLTNKTSGYLTRADLSNIATVDKHRHHTVDLIEAKCRKLTKDAENCKECLGDKRCECHGYCTKHIYILIETVMMKIHAAIHHEDMMNTIRAVYIKFMSHYVIYSTGKGKDTIEYHTKPGEGDYTSRAWNRKKGRGILPENYVDTPMTMKEVLKDIKRFARVGPTDMAITFAFKQPEPILRTVFLENGFTSLDNKYFAYRLKLK